MPSGQSQETQTEAVAVFEDANSLEEAMDELLSSGFDRSELSLLAGEDAVKEKLGHMYKEVEELEDEPGAPRVAFVSTETIGDAEGGLIGGLIYVGMVAAAGAVVASGGTLAAAVVSAAMAGGAGGLIGTALAKTIGDHHAQYLQKQLDRGGLLLWVRTRDEAHQRSAVDILSKYSTHDVHIHALPSAYS